MTPTTIPTRITIAASGRNAPSFGRLWRIPCETHCELQQKDSEETRYITGLTLKAVTVMKRTK
jgi:hypothetical protein